MKKLLTLLLVAMALVATPSAQADKLADLTNLQNSINQGSILGVAARYGLGSQIVSGRIHVTRAVYDFTKQGGAIGAVTLVSPTGAALYLPKGAIIQNVLIQTITAPTSGGSATLSFGTGQTATDLKAATAISTFTAASIVAGVPVDTAATAVLLTADNQPSMTIATAALTAGRIYVLIQYILSSST